MGMENNDIDISNIRSKLENLLPYISLSTIAIDYFGKTRQWFYQRLNESQVNGKIVKFTAKELVTLSQALHEIGEKMQDVSKTVLNNELLFNLNPKVEIYPITQSCIFSTTKQKFGEFSNMSPFPLVINNVTIPTSEALYQCCKYPNYPEIQQKIIEQKSPMVAKMIQKPYSKLIRNDWEDIKVNVMEWCLKVKLHQHYDKINSILKSTQHKYIVEESHNDTFWGAKREKGYLHGQNVLGKLWMNLRGQQNLIINPTPPNIENFKLLDKAITPNEKMKSLILDMDLTIIDRGEVSDYNCKIETIQTYCKNVHKFTMYDGWKDVFSFIRDNNIKVAIVSDTHETTIKTVISHFNIPCDYVIGHQSAKGKKKPKPFPMLEALKLMDEAPENVLSFGDSLNDFKSATSANIGHYACLWGTQDDNLLKVNGCRNFITHPQQIIEILKNI